MSTPKSTSITVTSVPFQNGCIEAVEREDGIYAVVAHACERLGVSRQVQQRKINHAEWAVSTMMVLTASDGKKYKQMCLHIDSVPMWLASIDPSKIKEEARPLLVAYQKECANVLRDYFLGGGVAVNPRRAEDDLRDSFMKKIETLEQDKEALELRLKYAEKDSARIAELEEKNRALGLEKQDFAYGMKLANATIEDLRFQLENDTGEIGAARARKISENIRWLAGEYSFVSGKPAKHWQGVLRLELCNAIGYVMSTGKSYANIPRKLIDQVHAWIRAKRAEVKRIEGHNPRQLTMFDD